jgi:hypothetical protein
MPVVVPETKYECIDTDHAEAFRRQLTEVEELHGVTIDGATVTVPGMDIGGAFEIAKLGLMWGHMTDEAAARVIGHVERSPKAYAAERPR